MDLDRVISYSLRAGVVTGSLLGLLGLILWGLQGFENTQPAAGLGVFATFLSAVQGNVTGVVYLGVILLVATPVFRVFLSAIYFGTRRDTKYLGISLLVLAMIILGLFLQTVS